MSFAPSGAVLTNQSIRGPIPPSTLAISTSQNIAQAAASMVGDRLQKDVRTGGNFGTAMVATPYNTQFAASEAEDTNYFLNTVKYTENFQDSWALGDIMFFNRDPENKNSNTEGEYRALNLQQFNHVSRQKYNATMRSALDLISNSRLNQNGSAAFVYGSGSKSDSIINRLLISPNLASSSLVSKPKSQGKSQGQGNDDDGDEDMDNDPYDDEYVREHFSRVFTQEADSRGDIDRMTHASRVQKDIYSRIFEDLEQVHAKGVTTVDIRDLEDWLLAQDANLISNHYKNSYETNSRAFYEQQIADIKAVCEELEVNEGAANAAAGSDQEAMRSSIFYQVLKNKNSYMEDVLYWLEMHEGNLHTDAALFYIRQYYKDMEHISAMLTGRKWTYSGLCSAILWQSKVKPTDPTPKYDSLKPKITINRQAIMQDACNLFGEGLRKGDKLYTALVAHNNNGFSQHIKAIAFSANDTEALAKHCNYEQSYLSHIDGKFHRERKSSMKDELYYYVGTVQHYKMRPLIKSHSIKNFINTTRAPIIKATEDVWSMVRNESGLTYESAKPLVADAGLLTLSSGY